MTGGYHNSQPFIPNSTGTPENSIERGTDRQPSPAVERPGTDATKQPQDPVETSSGNQPLAIADSRQIASASAPVSTVSSATPSIALRAGVIAGMLLEYGATNYQNDPKKELSYFVKVAIARGERTIWGTDLDRALSESGVTVGENITLEKQGSKPVTARERIFNETGEEVSERPVNTKRNQWLVGSTDKAEAFANQERAAVFNKHPDLAPAYGTVSAARKFAEKQFPDSKENQTRLVAVAEKVVAEKIPHGEPVPAAKIRETKVQEHPRQQEKDQERTGPPPQKQQEANLERARKFGICHDRVFWESKREPPKIPT